MSVKRSTPPKVFLKYLDELTGSLPLTRRTGDAERPGQHLYPFYDERTIIFESEPSIVYPNLLLSHQVPKGVLTSSISTAGKVIQGISDSGISLPKRMISREAMGPFVDSKYFIMDTSFFNKGSPESVSDIYAGLSEKLSSKIIIKFNLNNTEDKTVTRYDSSDTKKSHGELSGQNLTGFCYFNFKSHKWQDIGLRDPSTDQSLNYRYTYYIKNNLIDLSQNGFDNRFKPHQFSMSPHMGYFGKTLLDLSKHFGYSKIGSPTNAGQAPYSHIYHATASQAMSLNQYISDPVLIEKAVLRIPVNVRRKQGDIINNSNSSKKVDGANRDIDNYTFFLYRQQKIGNFEKDSRKDVLSSQRFLIMSSSAAFYNSKTFSQLSQNALSAGENLPHAPSFSYDFNMEVSGSSGAAAINASSEFEGTITVEFVPAICSQQFLGGSRFPTTSSASDFAGNTAPRGQTLVQNYWSGGTMQPSASMTRKKVVLDSDGNKRQNFFSEFSPYNIAKLFRSTDVDPRSLVSPYGFSTDSSRPILNAGSAFSTDVAINTYSPYLVFPEDEIVIGIDAGISSTRTYSDQSLTADSPGNVSQILGTPMLTGSRMIIKTGEASLQLFGSMIRNYRRVETSINQTLTSDIIHEAVGSEPIVDQYNIGTIAQLSSSYTDRLFEGSILECNRVIKQSIGAIPTVSGSLLRAVRLIDKSERLYDTIMPDYIDFAKRSGFQDGSLGKKSGIVKILGTQIQYIEGGNNKHAFPYATRVERKLTDKSLLLLSLLNVGDNILSRPTDFDLAAEILFKLGWKKIGKNKQLKHSDDGATGTRYGIVNYVPGFTSAVFRKDRYGQVRDMLEQRLYGKTFKGTSYSNDYDTMKNIGESPIGKEQDSVVSVTFFTQDGYEAKPESTDSVNLSTACSSSIPFIEGPSGTSFRSKLSSQDGLVIAANKVIVGEKGGQDNRKDVRGQKQARNSDTGADSGLTVNQSSLNVVKGTFKKE